MGYRNIFYNSRNNCIVLWTWDKDGRRIKVENSFEPYLYVESQIVDENNAATSIFNTNLKKISFRSSYDRYKFVNDTSIVRLFHNIGIEQQYLLDTFKNSVDTPEFALNPLKIWYIDIEVYAKDEFPTADKAKYPINLITIYDSIDSTFYTWGLKQYIAKKENTKYFYFKTEREMLLDFLKFMKKDYPDIITGWNIEQFDIPYIINRFINIFDKEKAQELSPVNTIYYRENIAAKFGKAVGRWQIHGISCVDYLEAYKTFTAGEKESYSLNFISQYELGEGKLAINATNLANLSETDWKNFVDYNIQDVDLVYRLEEKLNILKLVRMLAYKGLTQFERALGKVSIVTGAVALQAAKQGYIIPTFKTDRIREEYDGGYVKEPEKGLQKAVVSFDANSLYPSVILSLNISPETKVGKIISKDDKEIVLRLANNKEVTIDNEKFTKLLQKEQLAVSKYKVLYTQKFRGVVPNLIDRIYKERVEAKNISLDYKSKIEKHHQNPTADINFDENRMQILSEQYDTIQLTLKILLNSIYGIFAQKHSPFFDIDHAASVTLTGQSVVKQASIIVDEYLKTNHNATSSATVYNDTDSLYITLQEACKVSNIRICDENYRVTPEMHALVKEIDKELNKNIKTWAAAIFNSKDPRFVFKREVICDAGVFLRKKRYILRVLDQEGVPKNKFKYVGVEIARSSTPALIKEFIKRVVEAALQSEDVVASNKVFREVYSEFKSLPVEDIAIRKNVKEYEKYASKATNYSLAKRTPIHVSSSIYYNQLLEKLNLSTKYEPIQSGNKVKYFYTAPNKYNIKSIAFTDYYPEELKDIKVDYEEMFTKIVTPLLQSVYDAIGWRLPDLTHETHADLFDLFKL